jgi:hypothetical protein
MTIRTGPAVRALAEALDDGCRARPPSGAEGAGVVGGELLGVDS